MNGQLGQALERMQKDASPSRWASQPTNTPSLYSLVVRVHHLRPPLISSAMKAVTALGALALLAPTFVIAQDIIVGQDYSKWRCPTS